MTLSAYPLFAGFTNSPDASLTAGITATDTTIPIDYCEKLPAAPNIAVIGTGVDAEQIYYAAKSATSGAGNLTGCIRQYFYTGTYGVAKAWSSGEKIARNYLSYDHASILANLLPISPFGVPASGLTLTKDNSGAERFYFLEDGTINPSPPSSAYTDPATADWTSRYATVSATGASAMTFDVNHYNVVVIDAGAGATLKKRLNSYKFQSGSRIFKFKLPATGHTGDFINMRFCSSGDLARGYGVGVIRQASGAWNAYTVLDTTGTDTGNKVTNATDGDLADGNYVYIEVERDSVRGYHNYYIYEATKPATPEAATGGGVIYSAAYPDGFSGFVGYSAAGSGSIEFELDSITVKSNSIVSITNVPVTKTGFAFAPAGAGQFISSGTWTFAGVTLTCSVAGTATFPFQTTIGVHTFTPTLANGTDYYYFSGYRIKFVASGGNTCTVTLETSGGSAQGTGSLVVTTTAGLFGAPIIITETSSAITVTVAGATGSIASGTTTSTNAAPRITVGTATCTFASYSFAGTRYYMAPVLRGSQIGRAYISSVDTACTAFSDVFNYDTIAEYTQVTRTWSVDTANGWIGHSTSGSLGLLNVNNLLFSNYGFIYQRYKFLAAGTYRGGCVFLWDGAESGGAPANGVVFRHDASGGAIYLGSFLAGSMTTLDSGTVTVTTGNVYELLITITGSSISASIYENGVLKDTLVGTYSARTSGYIGLYQQGNTSQVVTTALSVNALATNAYNGIAVCPAAPCHGGLFDSQSECYHTFTNLVRAGEYALATAAITTNFAADNSEMYFYNTSDSTAINIDGLTTDDILLIAGSWTNCAARLVLRHQDIADTIKLSVRRKDYSGVAYDNQPAVWFDYLYMTPIWAVA